MNSEHFKEQVCIVTGANSGIGYAISEELLKRGAIVYMAGRNPQKISDAAEKLSKYQNQIHTLKVDVTQQEQVQKAIEDTFNEEGELNFLFNNAGVGGTKPFTIATLDDWKMIIDTNLWSVIYGVYTAIPIMLKQGSGHIINTSSIAGILPMPFQSLYCLTKFGVTGLTESLKYEYAERGLRFSTICPSAVASNIWNKRIDGQSEGKLEIPEDAYPADKAAFDILNGVAENKGIIPIPQEFNADMWKKYVLGEREAEDYLLNLSHDRREGYRQILKDMELDPDEYKNILL